MIIMSVIGAVAIIIIPSIRFGKRIKKQMQPVLDAIGQIKDQNLEYETSCSGIKSLMTVYRQSMICEMHCENL